MVNGSPSASSVTAAALNSPISQRCLPNRRTAAGVTAAAVRVPMAVAAKTWPGPEEAVVDEVVPVEQQGHDRGDAVEEPVRGDRGERGGDLAALRHVPGAG